MSNAVLGVLSTAFGTSVAFGYSTVLFAAGVWLLWRVRGAKPI